MRYLILLLVLVGCSDDEPKQPEDYAIDVKYCVANCMKYEFKNFHNNGKSWGTGSSSMNGLSQSKIYDRVKQECVEFYKGEKCCKWNHEYTSNRNIETWIHGRDFGVCK